MRFKRRAKLRMGQIDMAPLVSVLFLLLIFFMLTSNFVSQPGMKVSLPKALTSEAVQENSLIVVLTDLNMAYVGERPIDHKELDSRLRIAAKEKKPVLIKADRRASMGKIVEVLDMCRGAGISQINVATTQEIR